MFGSSYSNIYGSYFMPIIIDEVCYPFTIEISPAGVSVSLTTQGVEKITVAAQKIRSKAQNATVRTSPFTNGLAFARHRITPVQKAQNPTDDSDSPIDDNNNPITSKVNKKC